MRLFFALWPSPDAAERLAAAGESMARDHGGRAMPVEKIHLTLVFLGEVPADRNAAALEAAREAPFRRFSIAFDRLGGFRRSKVGWAAMSRPPAELIHLQACLASGLGARGFALEERAFAPHVTLVRKVGRPVAPGAIEPIEWDAHAMALVRTEPGSGEYTTIAQVASVDG